MQESLNDAKEELKRVDHLIFVTLKYTRTVDVLQNILLRMIDAYDFMMEAILKYAVEENKIIDVPVSPRERGELIKETFDDELIKDNMDLYFLLRKLSQSNPARENEYRRPVAMVSYIDNRKEIVNIDIISQYYDFQRSFLDYINSMIMKQDE